MSTSEARIQANRANALKCTGPKTEAGNLQSRRNSLQHGLAGAGTVLLPADEAKLLERRESWGRVLRPEDEVEGFLVEQAILHSVKLDRLATVESALACASVERADREYETRSLARIERVEAEVRDWERLEGVLQSRGTLGRDGLEVIDRLLGIEGPEDPRRSDLVALSRAASAELGGLDESSRQKARETLADMIGARLDERRRALTRLFEELGRPAWSRVGPGRCGARCRAGRPAHLSLSEVGGTGTDADARPTRSPTPIGVEGGRSRSRPELATSVQIGLRVVSNPANCQSERATLGDGEIGQAPKRTQRLPDGGPIGRFGETGQAPERTQRPRDR